MLLPRPRILLAAALSPAIAAKPLHEVAEAAAAKLPAGGIVTAESIDGRTRFAGAGALAPEGIAPEKRVFEIGSITKVFTGLLLADAVEEKKVRLDTTLGELLGDRIEFADPDVAAITLVQLSTHTSGLPRLPDNLGLAATIANDPYSRYDHRSMLAFLEKAELPHAPPFPASYSNYAVGLLGELVAEAHGKDYADLVAEKITGPLGMTDTMVVPGKDQQARLAPPHDGGNPGHPWTFQAMAPAGALRSTAADLILFGQALLAPERTSLAPAIRRMMEVHAPYSGAEIGLGIMIGKLDGDLEFSHGGGTGGYRSGLPVIPARKTIRVGLVNNTVLEPAALFSGTREEKPGEAKELKLSDAELDPFTGVYTAGPGQVFTVVRHGDRLQVRLTGQLFYPVKFIGADRFRYDAVAAELKFARRDGAIVALVLHQNGREVPAARIGEAPRIEFPTAGTLDTYCGEYELQPGAIITVSRHGNTLSAQLTGQPAMPVFSTGSDRFEFDIVKAALEFRKSDSGEVTGLILHQNGSHSAKKR